MVKKMISWMGALCALAGSAYAASATVWSAADGNGMVPPVNGWYSYPDAKATATEAAGAKATLTTATDKSKVLTLSVSKTNESSAAGMGFAWAKSNGVISLEDYAGVCLTYTAEVPFRLEFKQSTIKDYDFSGCDKNDDDLYRVRRFGTGRLGYSKGLGPYQATGTPVWLQAGLCS